jgi:starch-binding outer membrane protein, SusD/RagB family
MKQKNGNIKYVLLVSTLLLVGFNISGCKKFLQVEAPLTSVNESNVYNSDATAIAVLTEIYSEMMMGDRWFTGKAGISVLSGLSADELTLVGTTTDAQLIAYYENQLSTGPTANYGIDCWNGSLKFLFICNAAIEGLNKSTTITEAVKKQLLGEAKFMRAFFFFNLVNFYGDVPLVLTTDPNINRSLPRSPKQQVYKQIVADLIDAQSLLSNSFLNATLLKSSAERIRPTKWAATALLARTYLYLANYPEAETEASKVISNTAQFSLTPVNKVFLSTSAEAIWQMQPVEEGRNTEEAFALKLPATGPNNKTNPVYLSPQLLNAFEAADGRRKAGGWVDSVISGGTTYFFPAKYKATVSAGAPTEYLMIFRLAEQYLIRAEARAQQNNIQGAIDDLNVIRTRAELSGTSANDQSSLVTAILKERQLELFTELGHRWMDLKRTGNVDEVMSIVTPLKSNGGNWQTYQQLYPILYDDILKNPNLAQNPGY